MEYLQAVVGVVLDYLTAIERYLDTFPIFTFCLPLDGLLAHFLEFPDFVPRREERFFQPCCIALLYLLDVRESFQYESGFPIVGEAFNFAENRVGECGSVRVGVLAGVNLNTSLHVIVDVSFETAPFFGLFLFGRFSGFNALCRPLGILGPPFTKLFDSSVEGVVGFFVSSDRKVGRAGNH